MEMQQSNVFTTLDTEVNVVDFNVTPKEKGSPQQQNATVKKVLSDQTAELDLVVGVKLPRLLVESVTQVERLESSDVTLATERCFDRALGKAIGAEITKYKDQNLERAAVRLLSRQRMRVKFSIANLNKVSDLRMAYAEEGKECDQELAITLITLGRLINQNVWYRKKRQELSEDSDKSKANLAAVDRLSSLIKATQRAVNLLNS